MKRENAISKDEEERMEKKRSACLELYFWGIC